MALITASDYKTFSGISGTALDAQLAVMIPIAQARLESMCGRPSGGFESATWTQDFDGRGGPSLFVPCWPIASVTSVSSRDADGDLTTLDTDEYWISADAKAVERPGAGVGRALTDPNSLSDRAYPYATTGQYPQWYEGNKNIRVVYVGGYSVIPGELKMAMHKMLDSMLAGVQQDSSVKSETDGAYSYTRFSAAEMGGGSGDPLSIESLMSKWTSPI